MDSDEDLPNVCISSPLKLEKNKTIYNMPDPSELVAQRKLESEQLQIAYNMISKNKILENTEIETNSEIIAINKEIEDAENVLLNKKYDNLLLSDLENEITDRIKISLHSNTSYTNILKQKNNTPIRILSENPGINIKDINVDCLSDDLSENQLIFMKNVFDKIGNCDTNYIEEALNVILLRIGKRLSTKEYALSYRDNHCFFLIVCAILLDKVCSDVIENICWRELLWKIIKTIPASLKTIELMEMFKNNIFALFPHFHDRFYLVECLEFIKCDATDLETIPLYFNNRLAKFILYGILCEISGYNITKYNEKSITYYRLKKIVTQGEKMKELNIYQQYILVKILNLLDCMVKIKNQENQSKEEAAREWFLRFFTSFKFQSSDNTTDILKVKVLCSCVKFYWQKSKDMN